MLPPTTAKTWRTVGIVNRIVRMELDIIREAKGAVTPWFIAVLQAVARVATEAIYKQHKLYRPTL